MKILRSIGLALVLGCTVAAITPRPGAAQVSISVTIAPPPLPVYEQPAIPGPGYLWIPGYWAWDGDDYYWVPGYWQRPPRVGLLWTPGWWGWDEGVYVFHRGYWGPTVGFYGGVVYGFGYTGVGFSGGYWRGDSYYYNRAVTNVGVNVAVTNVYVSQVTVVNRGGVSYNGGQGGVVARPTPAQLAAAGKGVPPTADQLRHVETAAKNPALRSKTNQGRPPIAAVPTPGAESHTLPSHQPPAGGAVGVGGFAPAGAGHGPAAVAPATPGHPAVGPTGVGPAGKVGPAGPAVKTVNPGDPSAMKARTRTGKQPGASSAPTREPTVKRQIRTPDRSPTVKTVRPPRPQAVRPQQVRPQSFRPQQARPQAVRPAPQRRSPAPANPQRRRPPYD